MIESIEHYLQQLEEQLTGADPAIVQDALADSEEHLRNALEHEVGLDGDGSVQESLAGIIEKYGSPEEIAAAYREIEAVTPPALALSPQLEEKSLLSGFFSVVTDARAWGALLYLLLSIVTGIVYFTWVVAGISLSLSLMLLIIGLPFTVLFLLSTRSIALVEGRIIEGLLGVRMPRRPVFTNREAPLMEQVKALLFEARTWNSVIYMAIQLPLGVFYFTLFVWLLSSSLALIIGPVLELILDQPFIRLGSMVYYTPVWSVPLFVAAGLLLLVITMHLAKIFGRLHGSLAKNLLVGAR